MPEGRHRAGAAAAAAAAAEIASERAEVTTMATDDVPQAMTSKNHLHCAFMVLVAYAHGMPRGSDYTWDQETAYGFPRGRGQ